MKPSTRPVLQALVIFGSAALFLGCRAQSVQVSQTTGLIKPAVTNAVTNAPAPTNAVILADAAAVTNTVPAVTAAKPLGEKLATGEAKLRESLVGIISLAQGGVGEEVLLAYVQNFPTPFNLTAEEILYLTDLGIPEPVLSAMIKHPGIANGVALQGIAPATNAVPVTSAVAATNQPSLLSAPTNQVAVATVPSFAVTATPEFEAGAQQPAQVPYAAPAAPVQYNYFYSSLEPYGSWIDVPDYGVVWQPTVSVVDTTWRPYSDRGRWLYTDHGWYWHSDYSWGWAPFHYGRWCNPPGRGWLWIPDTTWGPAWVTWRYSDAYCGWAPLPPGSHFVDGFGFRYQSRRVGIGFDFGLGADCYTFIPTHRFADPHPWRHRLAHTQTVNVFNRTTIINNYTHGPNKVIIHEGVDRGKIAGITRSEIRKASVRETPHGAARSGRPDRVERHGSDLVVYRSALPSAAAESTTTRRDQEIRRPMAPGANLTRNGRVKTDAEVSGVAKAGTSPAREALGRTGVAPAKSAPEFRNPEPQITRIPSTRRNPGSAGAEDRTIRSQNTAPPNSSPNTGGAATVSTSGSPSGRTGDAGAAQPFKPANEPRSLAVQNPQSNPTPTTPLQRRETLRSNVNPPGIAPGQPNAAAAPSNSRSRRATDLETRLQEYQSTIRSAPAAQPQRNDQPVLRSRALTERSTAAPYSPPQNSHAAPATPPYQPQAPAITSQAAPAPQFRQELQKAPSTAYPERRGFSQQPGAQGYQPAPNYSAPPSRGSGDYSAPSRPVPGPSRSYESPSRPAPASGGTITSIPSSRQGPPPTQIQPSQLTPSPRSSSSPPPSSGNTSPSRSSGSSNGRQEQEK